MSAPSWFAEAVGTPVQTESVQVEGAAVRYLVSGPVDAPGLVFVHGMTAHAHWWWPVAARFAATHRIVLPDLSGHGMSEHRAEYSFPLWARELATVVESALPGRRPVVVGHSMGGMTAVACAATRPELVSAVVACDALLVEPDQVPAPGGVGGPVVRPAAPTRRDPPSPGPFYASPAEAMARFRTLPPQKTYAPYMLDWVVPHSLRRDAEGWTWSFDRRIPASFDASSARFLWSWLPRLRCPITYLRSEHGVTSPALIARLGDYCACPVTITTLARAGHHPMLDRPSELFEALQPILADLPAAQGERLGAHPAWNPDPAPPGQHGEITQLR
jgi:pimeloyl-ACP methyl ester carboxylesterase